VPPSRAHEQLERIRRRLDGSGKQRGRRLPIILADVEPARLELADDPVELDRIERARLEDLDQLRALDRARRLGRLEQPLQVLALEESLEVDPRLGWSVVVIFACRRTTLAAASRSRNRRAHRSRRQPFEPPGIEE
jgi:hypothetical protein